MKFYVSALVGVIIKVILQNARCNNKENAVSIIFVLFVHHIKICASQATIVSVRTDLLAPAFTSHVG